MSYDCNRKGALHALQAVLTMIADGVQEGRYRLTEAQMHDINKQWLDYFERNKDELRL